MNIHVQETREELENSMEGNHDGKGCHKSDQKCSPIQNLARMGCLDNAICAHCVHVLDEDIRLLKEHHASVAHCPHSNLKLASGIAPIQKMLDEGVNVCLGTDGASSNNNLDMLGEMRTASLIGKVAAENASALSAETVLEMATINGAKALRMDSMIGSIEIGKQADIIAINLDQIDTYPVNNVVSSVVYSAGRDQVSYVWVDGKCLLENRTLTTINEAELSGIANKWRAILRSNNPYLSL